MLSQRGARVSARPTPAATGRGAGPWGTSFPRARSEPCFRPAHFLSSGGLALCICRLKLRSHALAKKSDARRPQKRRAKGEDEDEDRPIPFPPPPVPPASAPEVKENLLYAHACLPQRDFRWYKVPRVAQRITVQRALDSLADRFFSLIFDVPFGIAPLILPPPGGFPELVPLWSPPHDGGARSSNARPEASALD